MDVDFSRLLNLPAAREWIYPRISEVRIRNIREQKGDEYLGEFLNRELAHELHQEARQLWTIWYQPSDMLESERMVQVSKMFCWHFLFDWNSGISGPYEDPRSAFGAAMLESCGAVVAIDTNLSVFETEWLIDYFSPTCESVKVNDVQYVQYLGYESSRRQEPVPYSLTRFQVAQGEQDSSLDMALDFPGEYVWRNWTRGHYSKAQGALGYRNYRYCHKDGFWILSSLEDGKNRVVALASETDPHATRAEIVGALYAQALSAGNKVVYESKRMVIPESE